MERGEEVIKNSPTETKINNEKENATPVFSYITVVLLKSVRLQKKVSNFSIKL